MSFEEVERGPEVSKEEYEARVADLRVELLNAQFDVGQSDFSVLVLIAGDDRAGCKELIDLFHEWMDARYIDTEVFLRAMPEERERPLFWRYWRALPRRGRTGLFFGAWAFDAIGGRILKSVKKREFDRIVEASRDLEAALAADGTLILKFWVHTPRKELKKRLKAAKKKQHGWRGARYDRNSFEHYDDIVKLGEKFVARTDEPHAPWLVVDGSRDASRNLAVMSCVRDALERRTGNTPPREVPPVPPWEAEKAAGALHRVDLTASLDSDDYDRELEELQGRLSDLSVRARERNLSSVLAFEGWDAAGKGGAIRRMTRAMAARDYRVVPIAAPTDEELAHHYLWRFWQRLPRAGRMVIFDRSWYGRVLVERVEGYARPEEWQRAYAEIREFERQLVDAGVFVRKFWLHIDAEEQLHRFKARETTPYKKYKITSDDYRNREKWDAYAEAVEDAVALTDSPEAPWIVVAANDKRHARVRVLREVCDGLQRALK